MGEIISARFLYDGSRKRFAKHEGKFAKERACVLRSQ